MHSHIRIERDPDNRHASRSTIPRHGHEPQRRSSVEIVRVNNVHIRADEDADRAETKESRSNNRRPYRDRGEIRPTHPKQTDGNEGGAAHGEPQTDFWLGVDVIEGMGISHGVSAVRSLGRGGEPLLGIVVDERDKEAGQRDADVHRYPDDVGETLGKAMDVGEDVAIAVEEGEEHDIQDRHVQRDQENDRLVNGDEKLAFQGTADAAEERNLLHVHLRTEARITGLLAKLFTLPLQ